MLGEPRSTSTLETNKASEDRSRVPRAFSSLGKGLGTYWFNPCLLTSRSHQQAAAGRGWPETPGRADERGKSLTSLHRRRATRRSLARRPGARGPQLRPPWRPLESVTDNHPEVVNYFRGRRARGGKLFPRTQISRAGSAAVLVVGTPLPPPPPPPPPPPEENRPELRSAGKVKRLSSEDAIYRVPRPRR